LRSRLFAQITDKSNLSNLWRYVAAFDLLYSPSRYAGILVGECNRPFPNRYAPSKIHPNRPFDGGEVAFADMKCSGVKD
jgi:hypothetical protein